MTNEITANDLKLKGITAIENITSSGYEAVITVRGKQKYVVMTMEEYNKFREYELDVAINESRNDIKTGKIKSRSIPDHLKRLKSV
ncbi:MAG: prevent-host-death protein [Spirochaetales bacterium]|nr:prevent-host-death protein [Spirochaetales bacterium]